MDHHSSRITSASIIFPAMDEVNLISASAIPLIMEVPKEDEKCFENEVLQFILW